METTKKQTVPADIEPIKAQNRGSIPVHQYGLDGKYLKSFKSMHAASEATQTTYSSIAACIKGRLKSAGGYQWRKAQ